MNWLFNGEETRHMHFFNHFTKTNNLLNKYFLLLGVLLGLLITIKSNANSNKADSIKIDINKQITYLLKIVNQNPDSALLFSEKALIIADKNKLYNEKAELLRIIGLVWYYKVNYTTALDYFNQSHNLYLELNNKSGLASSLNNISLIYADQGFLEKALKMSTQVLDLRKELNDKKLLAGGYNNLGVAYKDIGNNELALENYKKAIEICLENNVTNSIDLYYNNIGQLFLSKNQLDSAYFYFTLSLKHSIPYNHKQMIANSYINIGDYYYHKNQYFHAKQYYTKGLHIFQEIGIVYEIEWAAKNLHEVFAKLGNYKKAYEIHKLFKQMADSANNLETTQKIIQTESDLKYEKERELERIIQTNKELESKLQIQRQKQALTFTISIALALLLIAAIAYWNYVLKSKDNDKLQLQKAEITAQKEEIQKQRDKIERLNQTKDKFFAIIAHDLRNPLGGIYKLSDVVLENYEILSTEKLRKYITSIKNSAENVYNLLDNLLQWASIQLGSITVKPEKFRINKVINENIDLLEGLTIQKKIKILFAKNTEFIANADQKMINTVIRNLLTNAVKFTNEDGLISIDIDTIGNFHKVSISDTGIGISKEEMKFLFKLAPDSALIGKSKEKGMGLGLILCEEFILLNRGKIWLESEQGKGSTFFITIPATI